MKIPTTFGQRLKELRQESKITQEELAKAIGLSQTNGKTAVTKYENNKNEPEYYTLVKIADYLQVSLDYLLGRTNQR